MSVPNPEIAARHSRVLSELAEITLAAARNLGQRLEAAESAAEAKDLAMGLARVSRQVRQAVLLEARLERDLDRGAREAEAAARMSEAAERRSRVRVAVARAAYEGCEGPEVAEDLLDDFETQLDDYIRAHDFEAGTVDDLICAICKDLDLPAPEPRSAAQLASEPLPRPSGAGLIQMPDGGWAPPSDSS